MLTLHVRSRVFPQLEDAAQFIKAIIGMYDVFMENKRIKAAQAVANLVEVDSTAAAAAVAAEAAAMEQMFRCKIGVVTLQVYAAFSAGCFIAFVLFCHHVHETALKS